MIFSKKLQTVRVPRPSPTLQITNHLSRIAAEITLPDILPSISFYPDLHPFLTLVCSSASTFQTLHPRIRPEVSNNCLAAHPGTGDTINTILQ